MVNDDKPALELAHEVNKELLELILYRQQRKFWLSVGLLGIMVVAVAGLLMMSVVGVQIDPTIQDLMIIVLTSAATMQAKLGDFWFNNASDDTLLVKEATSYKLNGSPVEESGSE